MSPLALLQSRHHHIRVTSKSAMHRACDDKDLKRVLRRYHIRTFSLWYVAPFVISFVGTALFLR